MEAGARILPRALAKSMSERFLAGSLGFCDIPRVCRAVLDRQDFPHCRHEHFAVIRAMGSPGGLLGGFDRR